MKHEPTGHRNIQDTHPMLASGLRGASLGIRTAIEDCLHRGNKRAMTTAAHKEESKGIIFSERTDPSNSNNEDADDNDDDHPPEKGESGPADANNGSTDGKKDGEGHGSKELLFMKKNGRTLTGSSLLRQLQVKRVVHQKILFLIFFTRPSQ